MADVEAGPSTAAQEASRARSKRRASNASPDREDAVASGSRSADGKVPPSTGDEGLKNDDVLQHDTSSEQLEPEKGQRRRQSPSPSPTKEAPPSKRARRGGPDDASAAGRGRRLFGLLNQTLSKAKEDNARRTSGEAGRRRAEVEKRMQQKIKHDEKKMKRQEELTAQLERQTHSAFALAMDVQSMDMAVRLRKAQKRRLGSFLVTPSALARHDGEERGDDRHSSAFDGRVLAPEIATVLAPIARDVPPAMQAPDAHPVYYLPAKMLHEQDDQLDAQEDQVDDAIDSADAAWDERKQAMRAQLSELQEAIRVTRDELVKVERGDADEAATEEK